MGVHTYIHARVRESEGFLQYHAVDNGRNNKPNPIARVRLVYLSVHLTWEVADDFGRGGNLERD